MQEAIEAFNRGVIHLRNNGLDQAIEAFSEAIALEPTFAHAYCGRAIAHSLMGYLDLGTVGCAEAIRLDPAESSFCRARSHIDADQSELALAEMQLVE